MQDLLINTHVHIRHDEERIFQRTLTLNQRRQTCIEPNSPTKSQEAVCDPSCKDKIVTTDAIVTRGPPPSSAHSQPPLRLPRNSPLDNILKLATLQESIVHAKVQLVLTRKQIQYEVTNSGSALLESVCKYDGAVAKLARLEGRRKRLQDDKMRLAEFRKLSVGKRPSTSLAGSGPSAIDSERLFEKDLNAVSGLPKKFSQTTATLEPLSDSNYKNSTIYILGRQLKSTRVSRGPAMPEGVDRLEKRPKHVKYALTDVETSLPG